MTRVTSVTGGKRTLVRSLEAEGFTVTEWSDEADAEYPVHSHAHREVRVVLEGGMTINVGGRSYDLGPGDRIDLDPGEQHSAGVRAAGVRYLAGTAR